MKEGVVPYKDLQLSKKQQVQLMFDRIAFRYDLMNHLLSFGIDILWRRKLVKQLSEFRPQTILDMATGTGDVAVTLTKLNPEKIKQTAFEVLADKNFTANAKIPPLWDGHTAERICDALVSYRK